MCRTRYRSLMYVYGHERFTDDIEEMTGVRPGLYWQLTWRFIAPVMLTGLLLMSIVKTITSSPEYSAWIEADVSFNCVEYRDQYI